MDKRVFFLVLLATSLIACNKNQTAPAAATSPPSIVGNWNVQAIAVYAYDGAGLRDSSFYTYPALPNGDYYRFLFNTDHSWVESFSSSSQDPLNMAASGTYSVTSDSIFTLTYPQAAPGAVNEPCKILLLTNSLFKFSKEHSTVFNGNDPGTLKYVLTLKR